MDSESVILHCRGPRIAVRGRVNEGLLTGLRIVDATLPIGRGQRELILGDRGTGKTSIVISIVTYSCRINYLTTVDGFGSKRLFGFYIGLNQNLTRIYQLTNLLVLDWRSNVILSTSSCSPSTLTFSLPSVAMIWSECYRDSGFDVVLAFDDLIKHAKSYRQLALIIGSMPARQAFPSNIFNVHSSILERFARMFSLADRGSLSCMPILETISNDLSEFIATNVISITDGQLFLDRSLFHSSIRPSIDSSLSVSRIGSAAQSSILSVLSAGLKNALTVSRRSLSLNMASAVLSLTGHLPLSHSRHRAYNSLDRFLFHFHSSSLDAAFSQRPLFPSPIESSTVHLLLADLIHNRLFLFHFSSPSLSSNH